MAAHPPSAESRRRQARQKFAHGVRLVDQLHEAWKHVEAGLMPQLPQFKQAPLRQRTPSITEIPQRQKSLVDSGFSTMKGDARARLRANLQQMKTSEGKERALLARVPNKSTREAARLPLKSPHRKFHNPYL